MSSLVSFFATDAGFAATFSAIASMAMVLLAHLLRGRVRLVWFSPNSTVFKLKQQDLAQPDIIVNSGQIVVQNLGRKAAENVQIASMSGQRPAGYSIIPAAVHSTRMSETEEWIVEIPFIAPGESINLQILNGPLISSVRCSECVAKLVPVIHQRLFPKYVRTIVIILMISGLLAIFYVIGLIISNQWIY